MLRHIFPDGSQNTLPLTADAAADEDHLRRQTVDQIRQPCRHIDAPAVDDRLRRSVAAVGRFKYIPGRQILPAMQRRIGMLLTGPLGLTDQGCRRSVGLPAAVTAAGAVLALQYQQGMAQLRAHGAHTGIDLAVDDDTAAHAGAQRDEHHVLIPHSGTRHDLRQRRAVGVVAEADGDPEMLMEHLTDRHVEPPQIISPHHHASLTVAGAGGADTDAGAIGGHKSRLVQRHLHGAAHVRQHLLHRAERARGNTGLRDDPVPVVYHANGNIGAAQVNPNTIHEIPLLFTASWPR